ncbi:MAG: DNA repair protein RecN [Ignavibacteria bacterium]|jgi:DNA repair protein RecN (Recombination protein N)|nr:DNA repair protein RecN [Ignavibacteria bacterium]MDH7527746.1 DNA repair protein RecN [Ignavibacteria bacterium]
MIKTLTIKDYILIDKIQIKFESGLNIITGETGVGKSIIIDAMNLLIGEKASTDIIRTGAEKAIIEGVFDVSDNQNVINFLGDNNYDISDELIIRREILRKGTSRSFINDSPASLSHLKELGKFLIDLHGQHEHQSLLRTDTHIHLLDNFGNLEKLIEEYRTHYNKLKELFSRLDELKSIESSAKEKKDLYEFQAKEIDAVNPKPNEIEELQNKLNILENSERLYESTSRIYETLYESEFAVYDQLIKVRNLIDDLSRIDKTFSELKNDITSAISIVDELAKFIQSYNSRIEFNPELLEEYRERLGSLILLAKKYGGSLEAVIEHRNKIEKELQLAENFEEEIQKTEDEIEEVRKLCSEAAVRLSEKRREVAEKISKSIVTILKDLGINNAKFEVVFRNKKTENKRAFVKLGTEYYETTPYGFDDVEFYISTNPGEELKPLAKVASGGEISRIMLALKTILAKSDKLPLMVFDEIDVGISGRIAQKVGKALRNLSEFHQIIAITHLPQIAGFSNAHFVVEKRIKDGRAISTIKKLSDEEKVYEIAKLISGEEITPASIESAKELIYNSN